MAKARAIVKRRKAVENIRKITRTMELIATNRFKKALNRATEAEAFTRKIVELVADLRRDSPRVSHPLLTRHDPIKRSLLLVITSNRGLAGGYNGNVLRAANVRLIKKTRPRGPRRRSRSRASGGSASSGSAKWSRRCDIYPVRGPSPVSRKSRCWRTDTSSCTSRERSTAWTSPTPSSSRRRGRSRPYKLCYPSRPPISVEPPRRSASRLRHRRTRPPPRKGGARPIRVPPRPAEHP